MFFSFVRLLFVMFFVAASFSFVGTVMAQEQRYCAGGCDSFGNPRYDVPQFEEDQLVRAPGYRDDPQFGEPVYHIQPERRYRGGYNYRNERRYRRTYRSKRRYVKRRYKSHRRYQKVRRYHSNSRYHRPLADSHIRVPDHYDGGYGAIDTSNRTEFCRERTEKRGRGWFKKKVNVRRCVWVRNDLLGQYGTSHRRYADDW